MPDEPVPDEPVPDEPVPDEPPAPLLGQRLELTIGGPAHGGSCVARHDGRAVFVRHALPGERVVAVVTEDRGGRYCFADAIEVLEPSSQRVTPPCPHAGPGRCGGCDWQHASGGEQRSLKATVIREQFSRLADLDVEPLFAGVEELPGGLLGWRTRTLYALDRDGRLGLRRHASHEVEPVRRCPLGAPGVDDPAAIDVTAATAGSGRVTGVEALRGDPPPLTLLAHRAGQSRPGPRRRGRRPPDRVQRLSGPRRTRHHVLGREFTVTAGGFWQVHPAAPETFSTALLDAVSPQPGDTVLDLYAGAGLLTAALADAVGPLGRVVGLESSRTAVTDAAGNLADLPAAEVREGRVTAAAITAFGTLAGGDGTSGGVDVVVLDPPRSGAGREVMTALLGLAPRVIGYLACDPASLARDVATAGELGWRLDALRAFDAFPMTHHVECLARLVPAG